MSSLRIVAGIPSFNTEKTIKDVVNNTLRYVDEVVVIDDGSQDQTVVVAKAAGARVISHGLNKGYGVAIKSCFEVAKKDRVDILIIIDGDGQNNPDEIPGLLATMINERADLVIGSRFLNDSQNIPQYRKFGIGVITFLWNFGSKIKITDAQSGFRAYGKKVLRDIDFSETGMDSSIVIIEKIRRNGALIKEVPITC